MTVPYDRKCQMVTPLLARPVILMVYIILVISVELPRNEAKEIHVDITGKVMIDTPEKAVKWALAYSGFESCQGCPVGGSVGKLIEFGTGTDTSSDFTRKEIYKSKLWRIRYENVILNLEDI
jgi:hypothetical protein